MQEAGTPIAPGAGSGRVCLAATLGDAPQALRVLEEMLEAGIYYPAVLLGPEAPPPGLQSLFGLPEFEHLKTLHQERYREAMENAPPVLVTLAPEPPPGAPPPLLFAIHGNVSHIENEIGYYRPVTAWGWSLAMPQSSQPWGIEGCYVWSDWEVTEKQLKNYWTLLGQREEVDPARIVTAGISKGGEVALWLAMSGTIPACGFIAIAPGGPRIDEPERLLPLVEASLERGLRGYLIVGDRDTSCCQPTLRLSGFLRAQKIPCELEIHPEVGHWFPPQFRGHSASRSPIHRGRSRPAQVGSGQIVSHACSVAKAESLRKLHCESNPTRLLVKRQVATRSVICKRVGY